MFRSRRRRLVFPQAQHANLAGQLAAYWGNARFERPVIGLQSFAYAVCQHERGYGQNDNMEVGCMDFEDWLSCREATLLHESQDPSAEALICMHTITLMQQNVALECRQLESLAQARLSKYLGSLGLSLDALTRVFTMFKVCDAAAYHFCFELPVIDYLDVQTSNFCDSEKRIQVGVLGDGRVSLSPWPFSVSRIYGFIRGYQADTYPNKLQEVRVPFLVEDPTAEEHTLENLSRASYRPYGPYFQEKR